MYKKKRPPPIYIPNSNSKYYMSDRFPPLHAPIIEIKYNKPPQIDTTKTLSSPSNSPRTFSNCNYCFGRI